MTIPEIIEDLKVIAAIIEWDHSLEHQVTIEEAIKRFIEFYKIVFCFTAV